MPTARAWTVTESLPLCTASLTRRAVLGKDGNPIAYQKPVMMLIDEFSVSAADSAAAMFQDAGRGPLFGTRTNGAGGTNTTVDTGSYSEGVTGLTLGLLTRPKKMTTPLIFTDYIENVGVAPDIPADYMTRANLLQNGAPFVSSFLQHMAAEIRDSRR